jgi:radical SAM protein with 4Fe4S-binding SPASM domain
MPTVRSVRADDLGIHKPVYCVWEITLRCDHACAHCGSRAGDARDHELSTQELLEVADSLVRLGTREVTLIGGEAYLRGDCCELVTHLARQGVRVTMQTGGRGLTPTRCRRLAEAGLAAVGVSIDGPADVHDVLRSSPGSHAAALDGLRNARAAGLLTTSNSQINRLNRKRLRETAQLLRDHGVAVWRTQLTAPMGNAADRPDWILQPYMILDVLDTLAELQREAFADARAQGRRVDRAFRIALGNNMGYFGPHEHLLRGEPGSHGHYQGCQAGKYVMSIESDGTIKACPSLPTVPYDGGNVRALALDDIWRDAPAVGFTRQSRQSELWGFCAQCYYADVCQGGCSFTAHTTLGRRGNNPFCWHRANTLRKQGQREILVHAVPAAGVPYDFGRFDLVRQPWSDADPKTAKHLPVVR